jgi:hypothetical protein
LGSDPRPAVESQEEQSVLMEQSGEMPQEGVRKQKRTRTMQRRGNNFEYVGNIAAPE